MCRPTVNLGDHGSRLDVRSSGRVGEEHVLSRQKKDLFVSNFQRWNVATETTRLLKPLRKRRQSAPVTYRSATPRQFRHETGFSDNCRLAGGR